MNCLSQQKDGADILVSYFERKLDAKRTMALERHVAECAECRALVGVWDTLDEWSPAALPQISADFDSRLYARIERESRPTWWQRWAEYFKPAFPLAAGCAALALVMLQAPAPEPRTKAKIESISIEQVEQSLENLDLLAPAGAGAEL